jgi:hypothetical protein
MEDNEEEEAAGAEGAPSHENGQGAKRTTGDGLPPDDERRRFLHLLHGLPLSPGSMELDAVPLSSNKRR